MTITFNIPTYKKIVVVETESDDLTISVMVEMLLKALRLVGYTTESICQVVTKEEEEENGISKCLTQVGRADTG
jgi:hypothetical protein